MDFFATRCFQYKKKTSVQCCLENYRREAWDVSLKGIFATYVLHLRLQRPKSEIVFQYGCLGKKSSKITANQIQENKFESKTKLRIEENFVSIINIISL